MIKLPSSLFGQTSLILSLAFTLFLVLVIAAGLRFILLPVAERSTADLAALMVLSVQTWAELPPGTRADFERELWQRHQLTLVAVDSKTPLSALQKSAMPYMKLLSSALEQRIGKPVLSGSDERREGWYWFDIPMAGRLFRLGFSPARLHASAPLAALIALVIGALLALLTSTLLVRRLTRPLALLVKNAAKMGKGQFPAPLPETGPEEIASLARGFNHMVQELKRLTASRSVLLAGISHDLRTPLTHMTLAVEMLSEDADPELRRQMQQDLIEMNALIDQALEFSSGLTNQKREVVDLTLLLQELIDDYRQSGTDIDLSPVPACRLRLSKAALRRVLFNLLDNAIRYGGEPVGIACECDRDLARIVISDRGPGIPPELRESVFEPFYRIEGSRNRATGGSGLGLAIVRQLADAGGWQVRFEENPGGGARAVVEISRADINCSQHPVQE